MKKDGLGKNNLISNENELIHQFWHLIEQDPDLELKVPTKSTSEDPQPDLELRFDDHTYHFDLRYSLRPSVPELKPLIDQCKEGVTPILVAPYINPRILEFCRENGIGAIDLNGRVHLRSKGLLVDRQPKPGRGFRYELKPTNIFVGKSLRIVRCLLTDFNHVWVQKDLVHRTRSSPGLVSRIVKSLISNGFVERIGGREFRLIDLDGLLDAWVQSDAFSKRTTTSQYSILGDDHVAIARSLKHWADDREIPIAFTQWFAAWLRHPYTEPAVTSAYVVRLPEPATLEGLGFRIVSDGGKVWLHVPNDEGVFLETQTHQGLSLASDAQIYVDLQKTGLRGPDQAVALRGWEGFCRP